MIVSAHHRKEKVDKNMFPIQDGCHSQLILENTIIDYNVGISTNVLTLDVIEAEHCTQRIVQV